MGKIKYFLFFTICIISINRADAQALKKGNFLVEGYHGFPNLLKSYLKTIVKYSGSQDIKIEGSGPFGGRFEYMVSDNVGLGLDIGQRASSLSYSQKSSNGSTNLYSYSTKKTGVMATFNYHFNFVPDNMDFALVFGAGYGRRINSIESSDLNAPNFFLGQIFPPIAMRLGLNYRYFFVKNIGANVGIGAGQGGIFNAGISVKL